MSRRAHPLRFLLGLHSPLRCLLGLHKWRTVMVRCTHVPETGFGRAGTLQRTVRRCRLCATLTDRVRRLNTDTRSRRC